MRWTTEPNASFPQRPDQTLVRAPGERLELLFAEYWKRILSDAAPLPPHARTELAIEIVARTFDKDSTGCAASDSL